MSLDQKVGNRRNFLLNNHRLNKDAVLQILEDVMETVNNANVALLGRPDPDTSATHGVTAAGCDGVWQYSVDTSGGVIIHFNDPGYLVYGAKDLNGKACTKVVLYDPASTSQAATSVNITAYAGTPGTQCFLWFRREEANVDVDAEYRWQTGTGEVFQPTATMRREYVEFAVTGTGYHPTYNEENGYFKFARIKEWLSATSPNLEFIHFTDRKGIAISNSNLTPFGGFYGITGGIGLVGIVKDIVNLLYMISDSTWNINLVNGAVAAAGQAGWYHRPARGLKQIDQDLTSISTQLDSTESDVIRLKSSLPKTAILLSAKVDTAAFTFDYNYATDFNPVVGFTWGLPGFISISFPPGIGGYINSSTVIVMATVESNAGNQRNFISYEWTTPNVLWIRAKDSNGDPDHARFTFCLINASGTAWDELAT